MKNANRLGVSIVPPTAAELVEIAASMPGPHRGPLPAGRSWVVHINRVAAPGSGADRERVDRWYTQTARRSWAALSELDESLAEEGYVRFTDWESGARGYVAWLEPAAERVAAAEVRSPVEPELPAPITSATPVFHPDHAPADMVAALLADYETSLRSAGLRPRSVKMRVQAAESLSQLGCLGCLTDSQIEAWVYPAGKTLEPETIRSRRASARRFFGWLHTTGRATADPTAELAAVRIPPKPAKIIPDEAFHAALAKCTSALERAMLMLGRYACLRLSEIAELRVEHRSGEVLTVHGKGGTVRRVWLSGDTQSALTAIEGDAREGWYFPGRFSGHLHAESVHKIIKRAAGGWNPHSLRHAGATAAYRNTRNLRGVQALLGHASLSTTQRYLTISDDEMRALATATERSETGDAR